MLCPLSIIYFAILIFHFQISSMGNGIEILCEPAAGLSKMYLYHSLYFTSLNTTYYLFIECGVLLWVKSIPTELSVLNVSFIRVLIA